MLDSGGTLAVFLGLHALKRGYEATVYTYNLNVFDPTWFRGKAVDMRARLEQQARLRAEPKLRLASEAYLEFLDRGGRVRFQDLTPSLLRRHLKRGVPVLTGLSATYLYQSMRERPDDDSFDDVRGQPSGHFVVLCGFDLSNRKVLVADPLQPNEFGPPDNLYAVDVARLINAILLGIVTYDGNLLIIEPARRGR
jgi:hypothetical protein